MAYVVVQPDELYHYGILGQKWGVRRYQNEDGTLTEAGKNRYGYNLDLKDTSRSNIARIRKGEAKRRYEYSKMNNPGNHYRQAELRGRVRTASRVEKEAKKYDRGAKLAANGQTVLGNSARAYLGWVAAGAGTALIGYALAKRINDIAPGDIRYQQVGALLTRASKITLNAIAAGYTVKQWSNNAALRSYYHGRVSGQSTIKQVGSQEYKDRIEKAKNK